jgi:hypothetical protein
VACHNWKEAWDEIFRAACRGKMAVRTFPFSNTDEALAGDLLEQFTQGRSAAWYWRQVLWAIVIGFGKDVRTHWILAIRTTIVGLAVSTGASMLLLFLIVTLRKDGILHGTRFPDLCRGPCHHSYLAS